MKTSPRVMRYPDSAKNYLLFHILSLYILQFAWWSPLCAFRQLLNAFALEYRTVNISVFYVNLGLLGVLSLLFAKIKSVASNEHHVRKHHLAGIDDYNTGSGIGWGAHQTRMLCWTRWELFLSGTRACVGGLGQCQNVGGSIYS